MKHRAATECRRARGALALGLALAAFLASCGAGTAAIVDGSASDSSSGNAPTTVGALAVPTARTSPATVSFALSDPDSDFARVRLRYLSPGATLDQGIDLILLGNSPLERVPTNTVTTFAWDFAAQLGSTAFTPGLEVVVTVNGQDDFDSLGNTALVDVGNDRPGILEVTVPAPTVEVFGPIAIPIVVRDPAGDPLDLAIEFEHPVAGWLRARPAGLASTPAFAMEDVPSDADGLATTFVWDSAFDLPTADAQVRLRIAAYDGLLTTDDFQTPAFHIDNNDPPSVRLLDASLVISEDQREGLAVPFVVTDVESDPIEVVVQWQVAGTGFPELELEPEALRAVLADPVRRRELQIVTERPLVHQGRVGRLPEEEGLDPLRHMRLPELGRHEIHALARGLAGRVLEFPRGLVPRPIGDTWSERVLVRPVAVLPTSDELGALVLDEPSPGSWRLREIELETGAAQRVVASGAGSPRALASATDEGWLVGVHQGADFEVLWIADDGTLRDSLRASEHGVLGPLRGLAGRAPGVWLATAGSALVEGRFAGADSRVLLVLDGLEEPWGIVVDPDDPERAYVAERSARRYALHALEPRLAGGVVSVVDLVTRAAWPLHTEPPGLPHPTGLALDRAHRHLYALTDSDPSDGLLELRGVHLDGPHAYEPFTVTDELPSSAASLAFGTRELRLVALPETDELAVGGGVGVRRTIAEGPDPAPYDPARQIAAVEPPLRESVPPGSPWRLGGTLGAARSAPEGVLNTLLWDLPADFATDADVVIRAIPLDRDVGPLDESIVSKRASVFGFDEESEPLELVTPFAATDLALADLDGDGLEDLVMSAAAAHTIALFPQDSAGSFAADPERVISLPANSFPGDVACGDVSGDGLADLLVACGGLGAVAVFVQGPSGLPDQATTMLELEGSPVKLALADIDLDGRTDVVVASSGTDDVRIFTRGADGSFVMAPDRMRLFAVPNQLVVGDVDGDGDVDVVASRPAGPGDPDRFQAVSAWLFARGSDGSYPATPTHVFKAREKVNTQLLLEDLNGDGAPDLVVVANGILDFSADGGLGVVSVFFLGDEELPTEPDLFLPIQKGQHLAVRDLDGNGEMDVIAASRDEFPGFIPFHGGLGVWLQRDGVFEFFLGLDTRDHARVIVDDLGADGSLEIVTLGAQFVRQPLDRLRIWKASGGGLDLDTPDALLSTPCALGEICRPVEAADFNGDGQVDLLEFSRSTLSGRDVELRIRLQEGPRLFEAVPSTSVTSAGGFLLPRRSADLDGNGRLDLVTRVADGYCVQYQRSTGRQPSFDPGPRISDAGSELMGIEDFDGDGRFDLAFLTFDPALAVALHLAQPGGTFAELPDLVLPLQSDSGDVGQVTDLNADGRPDLLLTGTSSFNAEVFLGEEGSILPASPSYSIVDPDPSSQTGPVMAEDLDRDGLPDLHFGLEGELVVFFQRANGFPSVPDLRIPIADVLGLGIGDFEGDGDLDVLGHSSPSSGLFVFPWTAHRRLGFLGTATFGSNNPPRFVIADIDLDGSLDAVLAQAGVALHYGR